MMPVMAVERKEIRAYGVRALLSSHPEVRRLKRHAAPSVHGTKHWPSSWLLMDYLKRTGLMRQARVIEIGAGWGLLSVFCAKAFDARVTAVDLDPDVFPFLRLHAKVNGIEVEELQLEFDKIAVRHLRGVDLLVGSDICFWDAMVGPLRRLIRRALRAGVGQILLADPGRGPFEVVAGELADSGRGAVFDWTAKRPRSISGRILRIDSAADTRL